MAMKTYAQLDFASGDIKRVSLIGGEEVGIIKSLIDAYPTEFVDLTGRINKPLDTFDWWYVVETDTFVKTADIPKPPEPEPTPSEQRHVAYETMTEKADGTPLLLFHERKYTVNKAVSEYRAYYEGLAPDAEDFKTQINLAREYIRSLYPEE